ncbi:MAG: hypothetical protein ACRDT2_01500 [Natronosporangium sp.]
MASLQTLERRIAALEARLAEVEGGYGESIFRLHRNSVELKLNVSRIMGHLGVAAANADEVEAAMDDD